MFELKGLQQLKELAGGINAAGQFMMLPIDDVVSEAQVRKNFADIEALADSIKAEGLQQPINVAKRMDGKYVIVQGERRWRACKLLGMKKIEAIVRPQLKVDKDRSILQLIENVQRQDMDVFEIGDAFNHLIENEGMTRSELASRIGWSVSKVSRFATVGLIPPEVRQTLEKFETKDYIVLQDISKVCSNPDKTNQALNELLEAGLPLNRKNALRVAEFVKGRVVEVIEPETVKETPHPEEKETSEESDKPVTITPKEVIKDEPEHSEEEPEDQPQGSEEDTPVTPVKETRERTKNKSKMLLPDDVTEVSPTGYRLKVAVQLDDEILVGYLATNLLCRNPDKVCVIHNDKPYTFFNHQVAVLGLIAEDKYNEEI